jgi:hypothetical protein
MTHPVSITGPSFHHVCRAALALVFSTLLLVVLPSRARAAGQARSLAVLPTAADAGQIAASMRHALAEEGFSIADADGLRKKLSHAQNKAHTLGTTDRDTLVGDIRNVALETGTDIVLLLDVRRDRKERVARVTLIRARDTSAPFEYGLKLPRKADPPAQAHALLSGLAGRLSAESADSDLTSITEIPNDPRREPKAASGTGTAEKDSAPKESAPSRPRDFAHALVVASPHFAVGTRHFDFVDRVTPGQRAYNLAAAPLVGVSGEVYPLAFMGNDLYSALGISGEYASAILVRSRSPDGQKVDTSWTHLDLALRGRMPLPPYVIVGGKLGYGVTDFSLSGGDALNTEQQLPNASYKFIRVGVDGRASYWKLALMAGIDYLAVQDAGDVASRYPHASVGGIDLSAAIGFAFLEHFEARTGVRYQRFFYSLHPDHSDPNIAGGALDELARWDSSVAFYY